MAGKGDGLGLCVEWRLMALAFTGSKKWKISRGPWPGNTQGKQAPGTGVPKWGTDVEDLSFRNCGGSNIGGSELALKKCPGIQ